MKIQRRIKLADVLWISLLIGTTILILWIYVLMKKDFENRIYRACQVIETDKCRELNIRVYK